MKLLNSLLVLTMSLSLLAQVQIGSDIDGEAAGDYSGNSVSLSSDGTIVAIGATDNDGTGLDAGHVRIYEYSAGSWTQLGTDIDGEAAEDASGSSVSLSSDGTIVAIGALFNDGSGTNAGHVRIYEYGVGGWTQLGADINGQSWGDYAGAAVSLSSDGTIVAIGAQNNDGTGLNAGHVTMYGYNSFGNWGQMGNHINGEAAGDRSGNSVSLSSDGTTVAIGAFWNDGAATNAGHVRIYEYSAGWWTQLGADIDGDAASDEFGTSVSLSSDGTTVAIGAKNGTNSLAGHVRIYEYSAGSWTQLGTDIDGEAAGDGANYVSLSSDGTIVAIGAPGNDGTGTNAGHLRVYSICFDTIQQQPQSNTFYTVPGDAYFAVTHSDTSATYQWQQNTGTGWTNLSDFSFYSGTITDSLVLTGITTSLNGYGYRCVIDACTMDTTDLATLTVVDNMGIGEVLNDVVVSPNPTSGILNIVLTSLSEYEVFNINGQRVAQGKTEGQIDITNLPTGSYQIIITNDDGRSTHTIQKI